MKKQLQQITKIEIQERGIVYLVELEKGKGNLTPEKLFSILNKKRMELEKSKNSN